jgi:hypothetical protein
MSFRAIILALILIVNVSSEKAKVFQITSFNIEKFTKDPSYWFIQVSCNAAI